MEEGVIIRLAARESLPFTIERIVLIDSARDPAKENMETENEDQTL